MKKCNKIALLATLVLMIIAGPLHAQSDEPDPDSTENPTDYKKLFKDKKVQTERGLITLHKMDEKVYFEFPKALLGKKMLLGSAVEESSNSGDAAAGELPNPPLPIYFTMSDSTVLMREARFLTKVSDGNPQIARALSKNNIGPILASFNVKAVSPDSSAFVFDVTSFFVNGNKAIDPFGPYGGNAGMFESSDARYKRNLSVLSDISSYEDNITVSSYLSFDISKSFLGLSIGSHRGTYLMKRSLMLLPEKTARPRINDPRIGIFYTRKNQYSADGAGTKPLYYANRWDLEPKNIKAFKNGKQVEPVKPITFYIDDHFPKQWLPYIKAGINDWNEAFRAIGFKNAIVTKMYPKDNPDFDPDNLKYTCIKYSATPKQNAMGPSWVDPRSGEILSATVYIYHGITDLLNDWIFRYTAAADKRARTTKVADNLIGKGLRYVVAHEVGHTLGLMHNMGASSAFPTDSLRSPRFTQKYGTTPSIMDYARFNVVAQPGDVERGVKLTPPHLGMYDKYAIKWLYTPIFDAESPEDEVPVLDQWISEKIDDPRYRYGKQQLTVIDPSAQAEDLGADHIKTAKYAINNFKYIMDNLNDWVKDEDEDLSFRTKQHFELLNIYFVWPLIHVMRNIGGIYQYETYAGDSLPAYEVVPEAKQRASTLFILKTIEDLGWFNNDILNENSNNINDQPAEFIRRYFIQSLMMLRPRRLAFSEDKAVGDTYTRKEFIEDIFNFVWGSTMQGQQPSDGKRAMQSTLTNLLIQYSNVESIPNTDPFAFRIHAELSQNSIEQLGAEGPLQSLERSYAVRKLPQIKQRKATGGDVSGFGLFPGVTYKSANIDHLYYKWLLKTRDILEDAVDNQTGDLQLRYQYMLLKVKRALNEE